MDKNGNLVKTWKNRPGGRNEQGGMGLSGVEKGDYTYQIAARDSSGGPVTANTSDFWAGHRRSLPEQPDNRHFKRA